MLKDSNNVTPRRRYYPLIAAFAAVPFLAFSQESAEDSEEIFELSPFEVQADDNEGYRAENTLSGSRLNSSLKDVPAIVDVSTKELLEDLAVENFAELMVYQGNTQEHEHDDDGSINSGGFNSIAPQISYRSRGFVSGGARDFVGWNTPDDSYNVSRYDFSRGPNGVLFGVGAVGGISNATTKRAVAHRDFTNLNLSYGSWDYKRATMDINKAVVEDRFGLRLNILEQDSGGYRNFTFKESSRAALAATFKIAEGTVLRAAFEDGEQKASNHRPFGPSENFSEWLGEGMSAPTYGGGRAQAQATNGVGTMGGNPTWTEVGGTGYNTFYSPLTTVYNDANDENYRVNYAGRFLSPDVEEFGEYAISDKAAVQGPDSFNEAKWDQLLLNFEHRFNKNFHVELAYFDERMDTYGQNPGGSTVRVDILEDYGNPVQWQWRPYQNGQWLEENANVGEFYMENNWRASTGYKDLSGHRAVVSYNLDLTDKADGFLGGLLGNHTFAGLYESREELTERSNNIEVLSTASRMAIEAAIDADRTNPTGNLPTLANPLGGGPNFTNVNAHHRRNRVYRRNYVTFGDWDTFHTGSFDPNDTSFEMELLDGSTIELDTVQVASSANGLSSDITENEAKMIATQSYFFDDRFVLTAGYRTDKIDVDRAATSLDTTGAIGNFIDGYDGVDYNGDGEVGEYVLLKDEEFRSKYSLSGITRSFGGVFHVLPNVSVFANQSSGRKLPSVGQQVAPYGELAPGESGEGYDIGINMGLLDNKLTARFNRFELDGEDRFIWSHFGTWGIANNIIKEIREEAEDQGMLGTDVIDEAAYAYHLPNFNGSLGDVQTEGYEMRLVGRVNNNLTLVFNYSYSTRRFNNVGLKNYAWMEGELDYYEDRLNSLGLDMDSPIFSDLRIDNNGDPILDDDGNMTYNVMTIDGVERLSARDAVDAILGRREKEQVLRGLGFNERPHKVNFTAKYQFREGALKGLSVGGSGRWQSKNLIDVEFDFDDQNGNFNLDYNEYQADEDGVIDIKKKYYGPESVKTDLFVKYGFKLPFLSDGTKMDLQLNVTNIFNDTEPMIKGYTNSFESVSQYSFQEPRRYRLTARFNF